MNFIFIFFLQKEVIDNCVVGMVCVAKYSEDDSWYRAKIINTFPPNTVEVFFVDYGNKETTNKSNVKKISSEFLNVSFKAVECSLANVDLRNIVPEMIKKFRDLVLNNTFTAVFKGVESGVYKVELLDSEENKISEKFQNLMINESVTTTNLHVNSEENWNENFGVDENKNSSNYDNWNDKNDKYACNEWEEPTKTTTMANNSHSFWNDEAEPAVDSSKFSSKIKCTSHNLWNDGLDSANDSSKFSSNENKFSSDWKKSKTDDTREKRFSKYDKSNNFRNEPDERKNNSWSKGNTWNNGGLKSAQERRGKSKPDQWHYNDHHGSGDESTLNSNNRKAYKNERSPRSTNQEQQGSLENLTDFKYIEITIGDFRYVNVPNVVNPNEFYCRFMDDNNELLGMTEQLAQFYENINYGEYILENIHIGKPCCILSKDNNWCRGKIESITVDSANVFCVDYGCFENVLLKDIKVLKPEFLKVPMQILKCNSQGIQAKESSWNEEDISLFKNMTQDKCFLAQFLNKHSENTYSVTLLSVNALTEANVNKEFLKTGHDIKEPQDSAPSLKLPYSLSVQTDIPHAIIKIGDRLEITVTWVFTVERFYCQLTSYSSDFEEMMVSVQKTYSKMQELEAVIEKPNVDLYCVAQFSEDKAWYRAKIVYVEGNKIGVRYIDYGNEEVVGRKRIKYILPQFASLPIQAIKCQLNGIKCLDYKVNEDLVQKYFAGKIMCTFNSFIDDIYVVDLESNGKSISQLLIRDRLASPSDDYIPPTSEEPVRITFLNADLSHKINKSMDVLISYVESPYKFWCQLLDDSEKLDEITNSITTYYNELSDDSENLTQFQINTLCIAKYTVDNEWYRAVIKSCDADQAEVMFIDYGNSDIVPLSQIKVITEDLSNIPAQAVECSLHEIPPSLSEDEQKKFVDFTSENEIKMIINKCNADGTLVVTLLTSSETEEINVGEKLYGELMQDGEVFPSMPDSHESVPGYVTSVNSISEFFVQLSSKDDDLSKLMADLTDAYASLSTTDLALNTITQNKIYCAKYSEDNNWYRAVIKDVNGDDVTVFFIDYGNIDVIPREDVKILKEEFCKIPSFCYRCRLAYIKPIDDEWSTEAIDWFTTYILDKTLNICFKHEENPYPVMILNEENDNISDLLIQEKFAVSADELFGDAVSANEVNADAVSADEVIADAVSADEVPADAVSADEVIADTVSANEVIADAISADEVPADVVFANEVFDHFDWHIPDNKSGSESDEVVHLEDGTFPIIPRYRPTGTVRVIVSHVESADRFYVTPVNKLDNLEKLQEKLQAFYEKEHEKHENIERILMFQPCVTKFSLDERWYRAEIIHLSESSVTVKFVDYGNSETVTKDDLRNMHKKFISVPAFSLECSLADLTANSEKLDEARTLLEDLINEKEIDITIISNELPLSVCIISDKENIYNQLTESGLYTHTPQPEKVQYSYIILPSDCKIEVIISHALSPSQFYVQLPENKLELDTFMTDILNKYQSEQPTLEEFAVGDLCIAYYSVDQGWYRAMITAIQDDDYVKVIYVDYGNQEVVPKDSIKEILPEFKDLPFQAVNCSLTKMHDDNWDEEHCLMFQEMVVSDEKTFELECVANHITFYEVKLLDNGTNITEILIEKGLVSAADQENIKNVSDDEMVENIEEQYIDNTSNVQVLEKDLSVISEESINSSVQQNDSEFSTKEVMSTPVSKHKPEMKYIPEDISAVDSNNDLSQFQELDTTFYTSAEDTSDFIKSENIPLNQPSKVEIQSSVQQTLTDETNDRKIEDDDVISKDKDDYEAEECSKDFYENTDDSCKYEAELTSVSAKKYDEDIIDDVMGSEMPEMLYEMKSDDKGETEIQESFFSVETYGDDKIINEENDFADNSFQDSETNFISDSIRADTGMCLSRIKLDKESEDEQMIDIPADTFHSKEVDLLDPIDLKNKTDDTNFQDFSLEEDFQNDKIQETTSDQYLYKAGSVVDIKKEDCIAKSLSTNSEKALSEECRDLNNSSPSSAYSSEGQEIPGSCKSPEEKIVPGQISYVNLSETESCERLKEQFLKDGISTQDTGTVSPSDSKELVSDGPRKSSLEEKIVPGQVSYLGKNE
ncbi:uncharacterized protein LOC111616493 [Centruroides sculpturatus]|uniref:uncharacterized protein LOC111616493 n=1 Tax=Centruroides sculpturatus TaxID=218467 RepID=UPI000C6DE363|nr:uncharacterized protein LOC111616493 [Centruroides sculpturatus]